RKRRVGDVREGNDGTRISDEERREERELDGNLRAETWQSRNGERVKVAHEQRYLEEHHARVPEQRSAAERRQQDLSHVRLEREQQERSEKGRGDREPEREPALLLHRRVH